jgi:hypothetical protein
VQILADHVRYRNVNSEDDQQAPAKRVARSQTSLIVLAFLHGSTMVGLVHGCYLVVASGFLGACGSVKSPGADAGLPDAKLACTPSTSSCVSDMLTVCGSDGQVVRTEACSFGCTTAGDACKNLDPANGLAAALDGASSGPAVMFAPATAATTFDTDTGAVMHGGVAVAIPSMVKIQPGLPNIRAFQVKSLVVQNPVTVSGSAAFAIVSDGDVAISSPITLAGRGSSPGSGAVIDRVAACAGRDTTIANRLAPGAGGAGFGAPGGTGGTVNGTIGGGAGTAAGSNTLEPLRGGCFGGFATGSGSLGGGGGGAFQVSSRTTITVTVGGVINASGGGGSFFFSTGGGGSGGGILLEAAVVTVGGILAANGGGGACGGPGGEDGRTSAHSTPPFGLGAYGGSCNSTHWGNGGNGGSKDDVAKNGGEATFDGGGFGAGGAGGGGVGRIRVNTRTGTFTPSALLVSPAASQGTARTR